ncbi:MAG: PQQ-binding-like beta-propeller repeat protein [Planctomycetales bacterium]
MSFDHLIFVGFNSHVLALDRESGDIVWSWNVPKPSRGSYVTLLLDEDRLVVSANGYMYCLSPLEGELLWQNETKGFGTGVACMTSVRGGSVQMQSAMAAVQAAQAAAAAAAAG